MRVKVKETCCPLCAGELVVDNGKITCIDNCDIPQEFHQETMDKVQPVIDWVSAQGGRRTVNDKSDLDHE